MSDNKMVEFATDLTAIKPIKNAGGVDLKQFDKTTHPIESAVVVQVKSSYAPTGMQWSLRVSSVPLITVDGEAGPIAFRASELFNLIQNDAGDLLGFPTNEKSNLMKFMKDLGIQNAEGLQNLQEVVNAIVGKKALLRAYDKTVENQVKTYLNFRY